jgi:putative oxidoreductase
MKFSLSFVLRREALDRQVRTVAGQRLLLPYWTADRDALKSIFSDPESSTWLIGTRFLLPSLMILIFRAGLCSLDRLFFEMDGGQDDPAVTLPLTICRL